MPEIKILNRLIRLEEYGISIESDERHAEIIIRECGLEGANGVAAPMDSRGL